ncbi:MAG: hypothetical protein K9L66_02645 [Spirochaetaceae bacterium]|nr:hypothetical protein [Spirochaetaceae bacterium]MCF7950549.1 hypothetical protein [Spirochaetaceae bacterium]
MIDQHRKQFFSEEYISDRIEHPIAGTIDHIHAEVTASLSIELALQAELTPYAAELLRLAGHMHDSERTFPNKMVQGEENFRKNPSLYKKFKQKHALKSAETVRSIGEEYNEENNLEINYFLVDACYLVEHHEIGGEKVNGIPAYKPSLLYPDLNLNVLADILCEADSIAYFYANILTNWTECGKDIESLSNKIHFMYDRISNFAKQELHSRILNNSEHILGRTDTTDKDIKTIRSALITICSEDNLKISEDVKS